MAKYNSKKALRYGVLGNYFKTDFENEQKITKRYANTANNWKETNEKKDRATKQADFLKASFFGNKREMYYALKGDRGADINAVDSNGNSALHLAVYSRKHEAIKFLVNFHRDEKGREIEWHEKINLNKLNNEQISALHLAVKLGNLEIASILLKGGADPNVVGANKETPIFEAIKNNDVEIIALLKEYGADLCKKNKEGMTPALVACDNRERQAVLEYLLKNEKASVFAVDYAGRTSLMHASNNNNSVMMDMILKASKYDKEFIDLQDKKGVSTLMICCKRGNREATRVLLARGANPGLTDANGKTAMDYAKFNGNPTCFEIVQKAVKIYALASEMDEVDSQRYIKKSFEQIGNQNRVPFSCCK